MSIRVVVAELEQNGTYLLTQRLATSTLPLLWEFPGGRVQDGEKLEDALHRTLAFRIGAKIVIQEKLMENTHQYEGYHVTLIVFRAVLHSDFQALNVEDVRWVPFEELHTYHFPQADQKTMDLLLQEGS
ncbi:MAG: NUDIX hydrolase [Deltaproteobacteria bacterium]|nr:NUDIX hydrolase [Deltaproteobacteria bacterium]